MRNDTRNKPEETVALWYMLIRGPENQHWDEPPVPGGSAVFKEATRASVEPEPAMGSPLDVPAPFPSRLLAARLIISQNPHYLAFDFP